MFSNYDRNHIDNGILAPGVNIPGASQDGGIAYKTGTSFATPIVSGIAALILSVQKLFGDGFNIEEARDLILETAEPAHPDESLNPTYLMRGRINLIKINQFLQKHYPKITNKQKDNPMSENHNDESDETSIRTSGMTSTQMPQAAASRNQVAASPVEASVTSAPTVQAYAPAMPSAAMPGMPVYPGYAQGFFLAANPNMPMSPVVYPRMANPFIAQNENYAAPEFQQNPAGYIHPAFAGRGNTARNSTGSSRTGQPAAACVRPSAASTMQKVYCLGALGFDFLTDARMDTFMQMLGKNKSIGSRIDMSKFFLGFPTWDPKTGEKSRNPEEPGNLEWAEELTWTITQDNNPIYVVKPVGVNAVEYYRILAQILYWGLNTEDQFIDPNIIVKHTIDWIGIAGEVIGEERLYNGTVVPVVSCRLCGLNAWTVDDLVGGVLAGLQSENKAVADKAKVTEQINLFLKKIYFEFKNLGLTDDERAINYSGTNLFSAASCFADLFKEPDATYELDKIEVEDSKIQRPNSILKDIKLTFFHPKKRIEIAKKCYRFTIDVADIYPVSIGGDPQTWSEY
jgi:cyanobactin maturation PatA/PatG family protease